MKLSPHLGKNLVIAASLLAAGFLAAWLRFRPYLAVEGRFTDGLREYGGLHEEPVRYAVWDTPQTLSSEVNTPARESRPALSHDGRWLVFAVGERGLNAELWIAEVEDGAPGRARPLDELNSPADELAPAFAADALYFASDRSGGAGGLDIWRASFRDGELGHAEALDGGVNTRVDETDPAPVPGGRALAFASNRDAARGARHDLFFALPDALGSYEVEPLAALNGAGDEREPAFTADGRTLVFASDRADERGFDLYRSLWDRGTWLAPEALDGLNGAADERGPSPSLDGFTLYYSVETRGSDEPASADLFRARSLELFRQPSKPIGWLDVALLVALLVLALLALLAKRWESLEVLYKCFLVSLLVHLLLLWWFRHIHPENAPEDLRPGERTFQVRLASERFAQPASARERGGALELAPSEAEPDAAERRAFEAAAEAPAAASALAIARAAAAEASLPSADALENAPAPATAAEIGLREANDRAPRRDAGAPALALAAPAAAARAQAGELARPTRVRASAPDAAASDADAPTARELARSERGEEAAPAPSASATLAPDPSAASETRVTANGPPRESFAREAGIAPALAVDARSFEASASTASNPAPTRSTVAAASDASSNGASAAPAALAALEREERAAERSPDYDHGDVARVAPAAPSNEPRLIASGVPRETFERTGAGVAELELDARAFERTAASPQRGAPERAALAFGDASRMPSAPAAGPRATDPLARRERSANEAVPAPSAFDAPPPDAPTRAVMVAGPPVEALERDERATRSSDASAARDDGGLLALADIARPSAREAASDRELAPRRFEPAPRMNEASALPRFRALDAAERVAPDVGPAASERIEHTPYRTRFGLAKELAIEEHGGSRETEAAVARGLAYLAGIQRGEGHWGDGDARDAKYGYVLVGKTGLCMLAFLGAGHTQASRTEHSRVVQRALDFLLAVQDEQSGHFGDCEAYGHGIATYALAECYALTQDARLRAPLERAVAQMLRQQKRGLSDARLNGGWGYYYPDASDYAGDNWPRVSVTAWQVMALESARIGGLEVPDEAFAAARRFLIASWDAERGAFRYSHQPSRLSSVYPVLPGSTPAALFALSLLGEDLTDERYAGAIAFVARRAPDGYRYTSEQDFVHRAQGNLYFWYYSTLALFRQGDSEWRAWNEQMKETLLPAQQADGSWRPICVYGEYARDRRGDESYTTALCVLTLEIYYRYFTPLLSAGLAPAAELEDQGPR